PNTGDTGRVNFKITSDASCTTVLQSGSSGAGLAIGANGKLGSASSRAAGTTYYWCAQNQDADALTSGWSPARSFVINTAPTTPALVSPANAAVLTSADLTPQLTATFSDPNTGDTGRLNFQITSDASCTTVLQSGSSGAGLAIGANG